MSRVQPGIEPGTFWMAVRRANHYTKQVDNDVILKKNLCVLNIADHLFGIVVSTSDCHPKGPGFDSWLYPRNFSRSIGSGTGSTQPRKANWVAA